VVSIDRADKEKYRQMIDELFEQGNAKRVRLSSTPMVDQMLMGNGRRPMRRTAPPNDDIFSIYGRLIISMNCTRRVARNRRGGGKPALQGGKSKKR
jgi:hypothetical protein